MLVASSACTVTLNSVPAVIVAGLMTKRCVATGGGGGGEPPPHPCKSHSPRTVAPSRALFANPLPETASVIFITPPPSFADASDSRIPLPASKSGNAARKSHERWLLIPGAQRDPQTWSGTLVGFHNKLNRRPLDSALILPNQLTPYVWNGLEADLVSILSSAA